MSQFVDRTVDTARFTVWDATFKGWTQRPVLGWGPGATRAAYLRGATPQQLEDATRRWADAHDLALEQLVSGGLVTAVPFVALAALAAVRAWRGPRERGWALGAAIALAGYAALEPIHPLLTPMLGLAAGIAGARAALDEDEATARPVAPPTARRAVAALLTASLLVSLLLLVASTLERWGTRYGEIWALRAASTMQPWRQSSDVALAFRLAFDGRGSEPGAAEAAAEARAIMARTVEEHPWDVQVRLSAADLEVYLRDPEAGRRWIVEHVRRFPSDRAALEAFDRFIADAAGALPEASP